MRLLTKTYKMKPEQREQIRLRMLGNTNGYKKGEKREPISEETRRKMSLSSARKGKPSWNRGMKFPNMHHDKQFKKGFTPWNKGGKGLQVGSYGMLGKRHSDEWKKKMGERMKGRKFTEETKIKMREAAFEYAKKVSNIICPRIGSNETEILNKLETELLYKIMRQFKVAGYFVDGYIPEINLAIEVDESHHKRHKERDAKREEFIRQKLGCEFLRIKDYNKITT